MTPGFSATNSSAAIRVRSVLSPTKRESIGRFCPLSNGPKRRIAVSDADTKSDLVTKQAPFLHQRLDSASHIECNKDGLERRVLDRNRIIENDHDAIARIPFQRTAVLDYDLADGSVILAQQRHNVFQI